MTNYSVIESFEGNRGEWLNSYFPSNRTLMKVGMAIGTALAGIALTGYIYKKAKEYVENIIEEQSAQHLLMALSLDNNKLTDDEIKQKVRIILIRKEVMRKVNPIENKNSPLKLHEYLTLQTFWNFIDAKREKLPGEEATLGIAEFKVIEKAAQQIIDAYALSKKPDHTCCKEELLQKQENEKRKSAVIDRAIAIAQSIHTDPKCLDKIKRKFQMIEFELNLMQAILFKTRTATSS